ncbi:hypothetical protein [Bandra megavirus]|uniref:Uncharacterized protein n=1 Tax=Bandra megavirus TaxID=2071566 RepID=A0A2K9V9H5_9VIRU|nr:hypothetical protein [Bandra megavirus]
MAPDIIDLKEKEKFHDDDGNIVNIETRGEREHDKCYFLVKDVAIGFGIKSLMTSLINNNTTYDINRDYKYFNCECINNVQKKTVKKQLFLTYYGVLRVLFVSRSGNVNNFMTWAIKTLFTIQMGTKIQKNNLIQIY